MASNAHYSSSSSSLPSSPYEVFLNFRGETRNSFVVHLYKDLDVKGVHTFMDKEKIPPGGKIAVLFTAIEQSRISIPILSKEYAYSNWCLDELVKIMECSEKKGQIVLPIFLNVEPTEVRNQAGSFEEAFTEHQKRFETDMVNKWRKSLTDVANIKGYELKAEYENESKLITSVVERVLSELNITPLNVARYPTGLDSRVQELLSLLDLESTDSKFVGICGMGGIGKTTLANAIYNQIFISFDGCCFLPDVRSQASEHNGLVRYQDQLLNEVLGTKKECISYVNKGSEFIKRRLQQKKVLIILDDVDQGGQLDALASDLGWFGPGSRIIITTRNKQILKARHVNDDDIYELEGLDEDESLQLFSMYAFQKDSPPEDFTFLSKEVVRYADGLPLTLEVLGSFLCGMGEEDWKCTMKKLKNAPHDKVYYNLKISYDGLDQEEKDLFLDIACFFIGKHEKIAVEVWEACYFNPIIGLRYLIRKSLVRITDGKLWMHDQVRDMGRKIVHEENRMDPGKRSRLWCRDEIIEVLKEHKGTSKVQGILPYRFWEDKEHLRIEDLATISNLRFLWIDSVQLDGNIEQLPSKLRWLRWYYCPWKIIPSNFCLEKLCVLDLSYSSCIRLAWNGWLQNKKFENLKILNLRHCTRLSNSPDFTGFPQLQTLIFDSCFDLPDLHPSLEQLKRLLHLDLTSCRKLKKLPSNISSLHFLPNLILSKSGITELPESIGDLKSLVQLYLMETQIHRLPNSIGRLTTLKRLSLFRCKSVTKIPDTIGGMMSLVYLHLGFTSITEIPDGVGQLKNLEILRVDYCKFLESLPKLPSSLIKLIASGCSSLERLPNLSNLENLQELDLSLCSKLVEIQGNSLNESKLKNLRIVNISFCGKLTKIQGLEGAESLEIVSTRK